MPNSLPHSDPVQLQLISTVRATYKYKITQSVSRSVLLVGFIRIYFYFQQSHPLPPCCKSTSLNLSPSSQIVRCPDFMTFLCTQSPSPSSQFPIFSSVPCSKTPSIAVLQSIQRPTQPNRKKK